jgi:hypothetical protein
VWLVIQGCGSVYTGDRSPVGPSNALRNERTGVGLHRPAAEGGSTGSGAVVAGMARSAVWPVSRVRNETFRLFVPQGISSLPTPHDKIRRTS